MHRSTLRVAGNGRHDFRETARLSWEKRQRRGLSPRTFKLLAVLAAALLAWAAV